MASGGTLKREVTVHIGHRTFVARTLGAYTHADKRHAVLVEHASLNALFLAVLLFCSVGALLFGGTSGNDDDLVALYLVAESATTKHSLQCLVNRCVMQVDVDTWLFVQLGMVVLCKHTCLFFDLFESFHDGRVALLDCDTCSALCHCCCLRSQQQRREAHSP